MSSPGVVRAEEFASIGTTADIKANELLLQGVQAAEGAVEQERRSRQVEDGLNPVSKAVTAGSPQSQSSEKTTAGDKVDLKVEGGLPVVLSPDDGE